MRHIVYVVGVVGAVLLATSGIANAAFVRQSAADCKPDSSSVGWVNNRGWVNNDFGSPRSVICQVPDDDRVSPHNITFIHVHGSMVFANEQFIAELFSQNFQGDTVISLSRKFQTAAGEISLTLTPFNSAPVAGNFSYIKVTLPRAAKNAAFRGIFYATP